MEPLAEFLERLAQMPAWLACASIVLVAQLSEDIAVVGAGLAAAADTLTTPIALAAAVAGVWLGDLLLWLLGHGARTTGISRRLVSRFVDAATVERCRRELHDRKLAWILLTRVLPGSRSPTYVLAGALGIPFRWFATVTLLAVLAWTPVLFFAACWLGDDAWSLLQRFGTAAWIVLIAIMVAFLLRARIARWWRRGDADRSPRSPL